MTNLTQFENQAYLSLETFRKNGAGIPTPVWFAQSGSVFYVSTFVNSGKVKRIQNNPSVRINPCGMQGELMGQWVTSSAHVADSQEAQAAEAALDEKYGEQRREFMRKSPLPVEQRAYLVILATITP